MWGRGWAGLFLVHSEFRGVGRGVPHTWPGWICAAGEVFHSQFKSPEHVWGEGREQWREQGGKHRITRGEFSVLRVVGNRARIHLFWPCQTLQDPKIILMSFSSERKLEKWLLQCGCSRSKVMGRRKDRGELICFLKIPVRDLSRPPSHSKGEGRGGDQHCRLRVGWDPSFTHPRAAKGDRGQHLGGGPLLRDWGMALH